MPTKSRGCSIGARCDGLQELCRLLFRRGTSSIVSPEIALIIMKREATHKIPGGDKLVQ